MEKGKIYIDKVELDFSFYSGRDVYSDGDDKEEALLQICKENRIEEALKTSREWSVLYHLSPIRENLLDWYPIAKKESVLEIGSGCGAISGILSRKARKVTGIELSKKRSLINAYKNKGCSNLRIVVGNFSDIEMEEKFDVITLIGVLEYAELYIKSESPYKDFIKGILKYLKPGGRLLVAIENKMGLKYMNGANEDHIGKTFAGVNDYVIASGIRTFSKNEIIDLLSAANIKNMKFYYPMPDYKLPEVIYSDEHMPLVGDIRYFRCNYDSARMYLYNEAIVFDQLCKDGKFDYFANSFFVEVNPDCEGVKYVKYSRERREDYRIKTVETMSGGEQLVLKVAMNDKSVEHVRSFIAKGMKISDEYKNLAILKGEIREGGFQYKYLSGERLDKQFYLLRHNFKEFIKRIKLLNESIYDYNDEYLIPFQMTEEFISVFGFQEIEDIKSLKYTNIDALFHNMIKHGNIIYLIDYEWVFDFPIPNDYVIWRNIEQLYAAYSMYIKTQISLNEFERTLGFSENKISCYRSMENNFANYIFGEKRKEMYKTNYVKNAYSPIIHNMY